MILFERVKSLEDVKGFLLENGNEHVDDVDNNGRSALMIACMEGNIEIAQFLLDEGADPNKHCKYHNTPLHYACRSFRRHTYNDGPPYYEPFDFMGWPGRFDENRRISIIDMLVKHGAKAVPDVYGWTPICYAALYNASDIVEHFVRHSQEGVSASERVLALELLAFARSVWYSRDDFPRAYQAILKALELRAELGTPVTPTNGSIEFETILGIHECKTPDELKKLDDGKEDHEHLEKQGRLIGFRILPDTIKGNCLWESLFAPKHGSSQVQLHICGFILELESQSRVAIGTALKKMNFMLTSPYNHPPSPTLLQPSDFMQFHSHLQSYRDILKHADLRNDLHNAWRIHVNLRLVLETVLGDLSGDDLCPAIIHTVADLVGLLYESTGYKLRVPSMLEGLVEFLEDMTYDDNRLSEVNHNRISETRSVVRMMALAYSLLVKHEFTALTHVDKEKGTILHRLFGVLEPLEDFLDLIIPVVRKFIHFGFPIGIRITYCMGTILDYAQACAHGGRYSVDSDDIQKCEFFGLLSEVQESVLPLQELSARCVLQNRIPYRGVVPKPIIEGD